MNTLLNIGLSLALGIIWGITDIRWPPRRPLILHVSPIRPLRIVQNPHYQPRKKTEDTERRR
jgi:hypothetical protein